VTFSVYFSILAPETFLLFSQRTSISRMLVDAVGVAPDVRLPVRGLKSVRALDCDPVDLVAYWIENQSNTIRCARDTLSNVSGAEFCALLLPRFFGLGKWYLVRVS